MKKLIREIYYKTKRIVAEFKMFPNISLKIFIMRIILIIKPDLYEYKHRVTNSYLNKVMFDFINKFSFYEDNNAKISKIIWTMWWQGEDSMPKMVKISHDSKKYIAAKYGYNIITIDKFNYVDYINIDRKILNLFDEDKISIPFLSDIIRLSLLEKYGGVWIDSTVYLNKTFDMSILENKNFFTIKHGNEEDEFANHNIARFRWTSFFIASSKNNINISFIKNFLLQYIIKTENWFEYFLLDYTINLCYEHNISFKKTIDDIPILTTYDDLIFLNLYGNEKFEKKLISSKNINIIKTTYRIDENSIVPNSFLHNYIKNNGFYL